MYLFSVICYIRTYHPGNVNPELHGCCDMTNHAKRSKDTLYPIMFSNVQNGQDASYLSLQIRNLAADFIAAGHA